MSQDRGTAQSAAENEWVLRDRAAGLPVIRRARELTWHGGFRQPPAKARRADQRTWAPTGANAVMRSTDATSNPGPRDDSRTTEDKPDRAKPVPPQRAGGWI